MARTDFPELAEMRQMRDAGASYRAIGEAFGLTERTAHRLLTIPGYRLAELSLIKLRRARQERQGDRRRRHGRPAEQRLSS
jgi:hypothetical protein